MMGLLDALEKFDATKEVQFKTYAEFRIKGAILDELREMDWVPRSVRAASNEWEGAWREKASELGREPTDTEMASQMDLSISEYHQFLNKANPFLLFQLRNLKPIPMIQKQQTFWKSCLILIPRILSPWFLFSRCKPNLRMRFLN